MTITDAHPARPLITAFGGARKTAKALGHKNHTTVQNWWGTGYIPAWRKPEIEALAAREAVDLPEGYEAAFLRPSKARAA